MGAFSSTIFSLLPFALTESFSRPMTATWEKSAPLGFQHLVQPQTWLNAVLPARLTVTGAEVHLQVSVPPAKSLLPALTPPSTAGCMFTAMMFSWFAFVPGRVAAAGAAAVRPSESDHRTDRLAPVHEIEGVVDLLERHDVRDEIVD